MASYYNNEAIALLGFSRCLNIERIKVFLVNF